MLSLKSITDFFHKNYFDSSTSSSSMEKTNETDSLIAQQTSEFAPQTPPLRLAASDLSEITGLTTEAKVIGSVTNTVEEKITAINSQGDERTLETGDLIYLHDTITTGKNSYVKITLNDGTLLQFGPSSKARMDKYAYDPEAGFGEFESFISSGSFRYLSGKISGDNQGQHSLIKTPSAHIGIRGSEVDAQIHPDGSTSILHLSGLITIYSRHHASEHTVYERGTQIYIPNTSIAAPGLRNISEKNMQEINQRWDVFNRSQSESREYEESSTLETLEQKPDLPSSTTQENNFRQKNIRKQALEAGKIRDDTVSPHRHGEEPHSEKKHHIPGQHQKPPLPKYELINHDEAAEPMSLEINESNEEQMLLNEGILPPNEAGNLPEETMPEENPIPDDTTPSTPDETGPPAPEEEREPSNPDENRPPEEEREPSGPDENRPPEEEREPSGPDENRPPEEEGEPSRPDENRPPEEEEEPSRPDETRPPAPEDETDPSTPDETRPPAPEDGMNPSTPPDDGISKPEPENRNIQIQLAEDTEQLILENKPINNLTQPTRGEVINNNDGTLTYVPLSNFNGNDSFSYTLEDSSIITVDLMVSPINDPPEILAQNDMRELSNNNPIQIPLAELLNNVQDIDNQPTELQIRDILNPQQGHVTRDENNIIFTPQDNFTNGGFDYIVTDGENLVRGHITLTRNNFSPIANDDQHTLTHLDSSSITIGQLLANDSDPDGDQLTIINVNNGQNGMVSLDESLNAITFTPTLELAELGVGQFTYEISDTHGNTAMGNVRINYNNQQPIANDDGPFELGRETSLVINVAQLLENDSDPEGDLLTLTGQMTNHLNGNAILNTDGNIVFTRQEEIESTTGETWEGSFEYQISDGQGNTDTAQVTLIGEIEPPFELRDDQKTTTKNQSVSISFAFLLNNDQDITFSAVENALITIEPENPLEGTAELGGSDNIIFTPAPDFIGSAGFDYVVTDEQGNSQIGHVTIFVNNQSPIANPDTQFTTLAGTPLTISFDELLANDNDPDNDPLTITNINDNPQIELFDEQEQILFTPDANFVGESSFTYTIEDSTGASATAQVIVTVTAPLGMPDALTTPKNQPLSISSATLLNNDNGNDLTITQVNPISHGDVILESNDEIQFTPEDNFIGDAEFEYTVVDKAGHSATVTVTVLVENTPPIAQNDTATTSKNTPITLNSSDLLANDQDQDINDELSIIEVEAPNPDQGTVEWEGGETILFTPSPDFIGEANFDYTVADNNGATDIATVTVEVKDNQPPIINLSNDTDPLIYQHDALTIASDATVEDTDSPNFDNGTLTVIIANRDVNDLLEIQNQAGITVASKSGGDITFNGNVIGQFFTNFITGGLSVTLNAQADLNATNALLQAITFQNTASIPNTETRTVEMTLTDGDGGTSETVSREIEISLENAPPVAENDEIEVPFNTSYILPVTDLLNNDSDPNPTDLITIEELTNSSEGVKAELINNNIQLFIDALVSENFDSASFDYTITDGNSNQDTATVILSPNNVTQGTSAADNLSGTETSDILIGNGGNDTFSQPQGSDILLGNEGDDQFFFNPSTANGTIINGGPGTDALILTTDGSQILDLISNRSFVEQQKFHLQGIDKINISGNTTNVTQLRLSIEDVLEISDNNILTIEGNTTSIINATGQGWNNEGTDASGLYNRYTANSSAGNAELLVSVDITNQFIS